MVGVVIGTAQLPAARTQDERGTLVCANGSNHAASLTNKRTANVAPIQWGSRSRNASIQNQGHEDTGAPE